MKFDGKKKMKFTKKESYEREKLNENRKYDDKMNRE